MSGKATVDQIARRLGVHASTVEGWRQDALDGMTEALRRGNGKTPRELELEKKADQLEKVVTKLSIQKCLLEQALDIEREGRLVAACRRPRPEAEHHHHGERQQQQRQEPQRARRQQQCGDEALAASMILGGRREGGRCWSHLQGP